MPVEGVITKGTEPFDVKPEEKTPFDVHCRDCGHEWVPFYFPLVMDKRGQALMCNAGKACPKCVSDKVFCGKRPSDQAGKGE